MSAQDSDSLEQQILSGIDAATDLAALDAVRVAALGKRAVSRRF